MKKKKTYCVKVYWEMSAEVDVEAESAEEAANKAEEMDVYGFLDTEKADNSQVRLEVVPDSIGVDIDDVAALD